MRRSLRSSPAVRRRRSALFSFSAMMAVSGALWAAGPELPTEQQPPNPLRQSARHNFFAAVAAPLRTSGSQAFPDVFQRAARMFARPAEMFNAVIAWMQTGGRATLGGRQDLAQHFLVAGVLEAEFKRGDTISVFKEMTDGGADFDDLAAGMAGAEWARRASRDPDWRRQWAAGEKNLTNNLPAFRYGTRAKTNAILDVMARDIAAAYDR